MDTSVQVAIISAAASIIVASISYVISSRQKRRDELRQKKFEHYHKLLTAISNIAVHGLTEETGKEFASAMNTIALVAPQSVISALLDFQDEFKESNRTQEQQEKVLNNLLLEIRRSLELPFRDNPKTFTYRLVGDSHRTKIEK